MSCPKLGQGRLAPPPRPALLFPALASPSQPIRPLPPLFPPPHQPLLRNKRGLTAFGEAVLSGGGPVAAALADATPGEARRPCCTSQRV
jgi:hypothetical protein